MSMSSKDHAAIMQPVQQHHATAFMMQPQPQQHHHQQQQQQLQQHHQHAHQSHHHPQHHQLLVPPQGFNTIATQGVVANVPNVAPVHSMMAASHAVMQAGGVVPSLQNRAEHMNTGLAADQGHMSINPVPPTRTRKLRVNKTGQKRTQLTKAQHKEILTLCRQPGAKRSEIAKQFNVVKSTISGICKYYERNGGFIEGSHTNIKARAAMGADVLDDPLLAWIHSRRRAWRKNPDSNINITEIHILDEAKRLAMLPENVCDLKVGWMPNRSWVRRFNTRNNILILPGTVKKSGPALANTQRQATTL